VEGPLGCHIVNEGGIYTQGEYSMMRAFFLGLVLGASLFANVGLGILLLTQPVKTKTVYVSKPCVKQTPLETTTTSTHIKIYK
jgi:tRNA pseudouridine-54 N-methylase